MTQSRREFIKVAGMGAVGLATPLSGLANQINFDSESDPLNISIFSKHLQFLNYEDSCDAAKEIGFNSLDLTVRPKGHVLPENVESDLPKATDAMQKYGMTPTMFACSVNDASNTQDRIILETAAKLGYKFYRPAWYKYGSSDNIAELSAKFSNQLIALAELSKELGIAGSYHNHSGLYFGAPVWDLNNALEACDRAGMGSQYDIMHNVIEGGKSWEIDFKLIRDKINTLVIKDVKWSKKNGKWDKEYVPMGTGMVDFKYFFTLLKKYQINVPISIHYEYDLGGAEHGGKPIIPQKEVFAKMKKDLDYVRNLWDSV